MYRGDFRRGQTFDVKFTTTAAATGAPTQLAGTPAVSCYVANSTTQTTTGITLTVDFDGVTGLNNVRVVTTDAFYVPGGDFQLVITAGTVGGTSAVGYVVASFSIENRFAGESVQATAQGGAAQAITLASTESSVNDALIGDFILTVSGTGAQQIRQITTYTGASRVAGVDRAWVTQPDATTVYRRFPGTLPSTVEEIETNTLTAVAGVQTTVDAVQTKTDQMTFTTAGIVDANVQQINDVTITGNGSTVPFTV